MAVVLRWDGPRAREREWRKRNRGPGAEIAGGGRGKNWRTGPAWQRESGGDAVGGERG